MKTFERQLGKDGLSNVHFNLFHARSWEAAAQMCSVKRVFLEISQNSQENTYARVFFLINLQEEKKHLFLQNTSGGCF